jgi:hypothetical protein
MFDTVADVYRKPALKIPVSNISSAMFTGQLKRGRLEANRIIVSEQAKTDGALAIPPRCCRHL